MPPTPKKSSDKMFAWTPIRLGGEGELIPTAGGRGQRYIVKSRKIIALGDEVSKSDADVDDEVWQHWIDEGIVRPYPLPEGTDEYTSPSQAFLASVSTGKGEVDVDKLMEMGLSNPAAGALGKEEEEAELPAGA